MSKVQIRWRQAVRRIGVGQLRKVRRIDFNHPLQTFGEIGSISFDLSGLAPGAHTVSGSLVPNAGVQLSDFADVEAIKVKYFPGVGGPVADLTLDRIKTVGPIGFYDQDFESLGTGNLPLNVFRSGAFTEAGFTVAQQALIAPGFGTGGGSAVSLLADAAGADGATFWNASIRSELDFRTPRIPWQQENMEITFDLMGSEAAEVNVLVQSFTEDFMLAGTLSGSVQLTQANVFESFTVSVADFIDTTPDGLSGFDLEANPRLNFVWQIEGENWGFDDGNQITIDNISLRAVDVAPPTLPGDFNADGSVDAADYTTWRDNEGDADESAINNAGDGLNGVDAADYAIWEANFGGGGSSAATAVPEPSTLAIATIACLVVFRRR